MNPEQISNLSPLVALAMMLPVLGLQLGKLKVPTKFVPMILWVLGGVLHCLWVSHWTVGGFILGMIAGGMVNSIHQQGQQLTKDQAE